MKRSEPPNKYSTNRKEKHMTEFTVNTPFSILRRPVVLTLSPDGSLQVTLPAGATHGPFCIETSGNNFAVSIPRGLDVQFPSGAQGQINDGPFQLPDQNDGGTIRFPEGGRIAIAKVQDKPILAVSGKGVTMDPLPKSLTSI
jgi:hypothetical protein